MGSFFKKLIYAISANLIGTIVSIITTLLVPKFFGVDIAAYGYFQIFIFYVGYIGFFHFGWCDGIYLRDGGKDYYQLDRHLYSIQLRLLLCLELIVASILAFYAVFVSQSSDYSFITFMIALNIILVIPQTMLNHILQATNRIKEYAYITIASRGVYGILLIVVFLYGYKDYKLIVVAYNISFLISLVISLFCCQDIVTAKAYRVSRGLLEAKINIGVGIKLMFANIAGFLITGIVRWGIQMKWDVVTYGKISFTLSITNMVLVFINAVALVLYPALRQADQEKLTGAYKKINSMIMIPLLGILVLYYPIKLLLSLWLPLYLDSLQYMAMLFPLCVYSAKMNMLVTTYMKVLRYEKLIMMVNICGLAMAAVTTTLSVIVFQNLTLAMFSIVFNQMFQCVIAELILSKKIMTNLLGNIVIESAMTISFITSSWLIGGWIGMGLYLFCYLAYAVTKRQDIRAVAISAGLALKPRKKET